MDNFGRWSLTSTLFEQGLSCVDATYARLSGPRVSGISLSPPPILLLELALQRHATVPG